MIKGIIAFLALWGLVSGTICIWQELGNKQRWSIVKMAAFGFVTVLITFVIVFGLVILF